MDQNKTKTTLFTRTLSFLLLAVMLFGMLPHLTPVANAAHKHEYYEFVCSCGAFDPKSVKETKISKTKYIVTKKENLKSGPYAKCKTEDVYKKGQVITVTATVKNGFGNEWLKLDNGKYYYAGNTKKHSSHSWDGGKITKTATCTAKGTKKYTCKECGETKTENYGPAAHTFEKFVCKKCGTFDPKSVTETKMTKTQFVVIKAENLKIGPYADCKTETKYKVGQLVNVVASVKNGYGNTWYKLDNNKYYYSGNVKKHTSHNWDGGKVTKAATCTAKGTKKFTCKDCGATKTEAYGPVAHTYKNYICSACGAFDPKSVTETKMTKTQFVITKAENLKNGPYADSKTETKYKVGQLVNVVASVKNGYGNTWYKLDNNKYYYSGNMKKHTSHNWDGGKVTKAATCTAKGTKKFTCKDCGATKTEAYGPTAHTYSKVTFICTKCGKADPAKLKTTAVSPAYYEIITGCATHTGPYDNCAEKRKLNVSSACVQVVAKVTNGHKNLWYKLSDGTYIYSAYVKAHTKHTYSDSTHICTKCPAWDPSSAKTTKLSKLTKYIITANEAQSHNGPYEKTPAKNGYKKNTVVEVSATVKNGFNNSWLLLKDGSYLYAGSAKVYTVAKTPAAQLSSYIGGVKVTLTTATAGATIYYTTDGKNPTTASTKYTGPINLTSTKTIKAISVKSGMVNSGVLTKQVEIRQTKQPAISQKGVGKNVQVSLSSESGATIYYTTNGSAPTTKSTKYTGTFTLTANATVKAIAVKSGCKNSSIASAEVKTGLTATWNASLDYIDKNAAVIHAAVKFNKNVKSTTAGFYFGTSKNNLKKDSNPESPYKGAARKDFTLDYAIADHKVTYKKNKEQKTRKPYHGALKSKTTYYYQFYMVVEGKEYTSDIYSFTTK